MHWLIRSWRVPTRPVGSATLGIPAESALAQPVPLPLFSDVDTKQTMSSRECYERLFGWQWNNKDNLIFNAMLQLCHRKRNTDYGLPFVGCTHKNHNPSREPLHSDPIHSKKKRKKNTCRPFTLPNHSFAPAPSPASASPSSQSQGPVFLAILTSDSGPNTPSRPSRSAPSSNTSSDPSRKKYR